MFPELVSMFQTKMWFPLQMFPVDQYGEENNATCRGILYLGSRWRCFGLL